MRANPGGSLRPEDVVGRESLIQQLWVVLRRQSVVLTAERRIGKTSIIRKMAGEAADGRLLKYRDLEGIHSPLEFVEAVYTDVQEHLSRSTRIGATLKKIIADYPGAELGGILKLPEEAASRWKELLRKTLEALFPHSGAEVIFFWDELPMMLDNIRKRMGEEVAMELLDLLREQRQTHPERLRMVFTGSIGLHNVLGKLKHAGYSNAPVNDMHIMEVPPLEHVDAVTLALGLFEGEGLNIPESARQEMADALVTAVDGLPYFIHHVVDALTRAPQIRLTRPEDIARLVQRELEDPMDRWSLKHYQDRLRTYYEGTDYPRTLLILDELARVKDGLSLSEILKHLASAAPACGRDECLHLLPQLERDHYLRREGSLWRFRFDLIRRYWHFARCLED